MSTIPEWWVLPSASSMPFESWTPIQSFVIASASGVERSIGPADSITDASGYSSIEEATLVEDTPDLSHPARAAGAFSIGAQFTEMHAFSASGAQTSINLEWSWRSRDTGLTTAMQLVAPGMATAKIVVMQDWLLTTGAAPPLTKKRV